MLVTFTTLFVLVTTATGYWWFRRSRARRLRAALQLCTNREESARSVCWQSMLTLAELLRFEHPDADETKQVHRRLVRHVQSGRTASAANAEATIDMLTVLCDISAHRLRQDHTDARVRMLDAASAWRETLIEREAAEQALRPTNKMSSSDAGRHHQQDTNRRLEP